MVRSCLPLTSVRPMHRDCRSDHNRSEQIGSNERLLAAKRGEFSSNTEDSDCEDFRGQRIPSFLAPQHLTDSNSGTPSFPTDLDDKWPVRGWRFPPPRWDSHGRLCLQPRPTAAAAATLPRRTPEVVRTRGPGLTQHRTLPRAPATVRPRATVGTSE